VNEPCATIDFETRSACSLRACGAWVYALHPTTDIICLAYRLPYWSPGRTELWHPGFSHLGIAEGPFTHICELLEWVDSGGLLEAHNANFERCIWTNILTVRYGFPAMSIGNWRCSAAKAAAHALPRGLEDAGAALHLSIQKDLEGAKSMKKAAKPRKSRKAERELWSKTGQTPPTILWHESADLFSKIWAYCRQDVLVETELSSKLPDLSPTETAMYSMDQAINQRGFQLDMSAVNTAIALIAQETIRLNHELSQITNGQVEKATKRAQMLAWFEQNGVNLFNTQKETIDATLKSATLTDPTRRALEIVRALGRSSTAKYQAMANWAAGDGRVRGGLLYHGATTGRWSGAGVQPHNFVRGTVKDMEGLWAQLRAGEAVSGPNGSILGNMEALANGLRGAIVAAPGKILYVADYAAIEARVVMWLAGEDDALEEFRLGADIYLSMASDIYGYPCNKKDHPSERQVGKTAILGLGFQMGASKFQATCLTMAGITIDDVLAQSVVDTYRGRFALVKQLWYEQESAAIKAVLTKRPIKCGYVTWILDDIFLYAELPSGRRLSYPFPQIKARQTPWGDVKPSLTFMGINSYTRKWERQTTYGGMLVENLTQSVARDLLAEAMMRIEQSGIYQVVLTCHDEIVSESSAGSLQEHDRLVSTVPNWAKGLPVAVEGFCATRYRK
jgi:DNA polymerase